MQSLNIFADASGRLALTRKEVAHALGLSASQIDKLTKRGLLRPSRASRRPLYSIREIERFLRETTGDVELEGDGRSAL